MLIGNKKLKNFRAKSKPANTCIMLMHEKDICMGIVL